MPKKETTAADEAAAEVTEPEPIRVQFRGLEFDVPHGILRDARFRFAVASQQGPSIVYEALGAENAGRFLAVVQRGEDADVVSNEFLTALQKAAGWGNSDASR